MIVEKEFYFVRHGQTDYNLKQGKNRGDHPADIPLNEMGRSQAIAIEPVVALLPIKTICASPMKRVQETKEIITARLPAPHHQIPNLEECSEIVWNEMSLLGMYAPLPVEGKTFHFMERVREGVNHALSLEGPVLIVAHGGVHWAICCLMGIDSHEWRINNCGLVHFFCKENGKWAANRLC